MKEDRAQYEKIGRQNMYAFEKKPDRMPMLYISLLMQENTGRTSFLNVASTNICPKRHAGACAVCVEIKKRLIRKAIRIVCQKKKTRHHPKPRVETSSV